MRTIDWIDNDKKDTKWIVDMFKKELLYVDSSFQRRYVWLEKHQIKLIETILLGYSIPEIYLWITDTDAATGDTKYSIIDGQQRIGAVLNFINGKYKLKSSELEEINSRYSNKYFDELDDEYKRLIWRYSFSMRVLKPEVKRDDIVKLFLRLNSTDKSLNPQELRNAEFDGYFLNLANEISEIEFWGKYNIFSSNDLRRMKDIEFISSILIFLRFGIEAETTQTALNKAYDLFNEEYDEYKQDKSIIESILKEIEKLIDSTEDSLKLITKVTHLYTIIVVSYIALKTSKGFTNHNVERFKLFSENYSNPDLDYETNELIKEYKKLSLEGTKRKNNRIERVDILRNIMGL